MPSRGARRFRAWPLVFSVVLHLAAVVAFLAAASRAGDGRRYQPIEVLLLHAANAGGDADAPGEAPLSPAERQAARERQAMLDRLVQPTVVPDAAPGAPTAAAPGEPSGKGHPAPAAEAEANLPVEAGGGIRRPEVIASSRVLPIYPEAAQRAGLEGLVVLEVVIDERGRVDGITVLRRIGHGFDEAAVAAVRQWRFHPATRDGKPIKVVHIIPFEFRL